MNTVPGDSEQPVTVGDLFVKIVKPTIGPVYSPATVADLVSALRAEGWLVEPPKDPWDYDP